MSGNGMTERRMITWLGATAALRETPTWSKLTVPYRPANRVSANAVFPRWEKIMLRKFISAAVATVVVAIGEISLGPSPAEAWFYNQPYNRPCFWYEHQWYYEYYGHRHYYNFGYHYYGSGYYPHHKYGSAGPVVDCI
jgi:hypothetical protein